MWYYDATILLPGGVFPSAAWQRHFSNLSLNYKLCLICSEQSWNVPETKEAAMHFPVRILPVATI
jgi:hypothetical protein